MPSHFKIISIISAFLCFSIFACKQKAAEENSIAHRDSITATAPVIEEAKPSPAENYETSNTRFSESLTISRLSKDSIQFKWLITEKKKSATETMQGIAVKDKTGDFEIDEDEAGLSYPAEEYIYQNGGCFLYVRLSVDLPKKRAVVKTANCNLISYKNAQNKSSLALEEK